MASLASSQGLLKMAKTWNGEDRISSLPDSVIVHILSFLPTKWGIATSILSTRWKHLWASVPILSFKSFIEDDPELTSRFMNFVDRALFLHDLSCIQSFHIKCGKGIDTSRLNAWITLLIRRRIQELDISISTYKRLKLPLDLFTCESLVVLKLQPYLRLDVPSSIFFPSLKTLHISLGLPNNDLTERLFSSCPVLENLSIDGRINNFNPLLFNISSPVLKSLEIDLFTYVFEFFASKIVVNAPALQYLTIRDNVLCRYVLSNLSSLVEVNVSVGDCCMEEQGGTIQHANRARLLVKEISSVKALSLGTNTMAVLSYADDFDWPTFPNLIRLELSIFELSGWKRMPNLLARVPNLAVLILRMEKGEFAYEDAMLFEGFNWIQPEGRPACSFSCLKEIRICGFSGSKDEVELIKYLLQNAEVFEKMIIKCRYLHLEEENEFLKKLLTFPRGSSACQIQFA
ncbi:hypothetical protein LguiB_031663 [Lonicera macranthoides]